MKPLALLLCPVLWAVALLKQCGQLYDFFFWSRTLRLRFASPDRHNILLLKSNLQALKKGSDNIETFFEKIKVATDTLATVGVFLDDEDIVDIILRGLPTEFAAIKAVIRARGGSIKEAGGVIAPPPKSLVIS